MRHLILIAAAAAVLPWTAQAFQSDFNWSGTLGPGQTLEIKNVNGFIHAGLAASNTIEVSAVKTAERSDPASVRIDVVPTADGVTICAVYVGGSSTTNGCENDRGRDSGSRNNDVKVDFTVKVPAGVRFRPHTVNGPVTATGLRSEVDAASVNGAVKVTTTGLAHANTVNGGIDVTMGTPTWNGRLDFTTVNGSIDLTLPQGTGADVEATTVSGDMASDFPMTVSGRFGGKHMKGRIGAGGQDLKLTTVNGGIRIHQGDGRAL